MHFKDHEPNVAAQSRIQGWDGVQSVEHGVFCELGKGDVNFPAVLAELRKLGYQGWIVVGAGCAPWHGQPQRERPTQSCLFTKYWTVKRGDRVTR